MSTFKHAPAFDFYPERWTHGTRHMTKVERCDYLDLLCVQWTEDGIPDDLQVIARILNYKRPDQIPKTVLAKFPRAEEGKRRNKRLETERVKQKERYEKKSLGASKTNAKRWQNGSLSDQLAIKNGVASDSPPPTSDLRPSLEIENAHVREGPTAEEIVNAFTVRRDAPMECMACVQADIDGGEDPFVILQSVREIVSLCHAAPDGRDNGFIPLAKTFFYDRQWRSPEAFRNRWKGKSNGTKTTQRRDSGDLNADGRYA